MTIYTGAFPVVVAPTFMPAAPTKFNATGNLTALILGQHVVGDSTIFVTKNDVPSFVLSMAHIDDNGRLAMSLPVVPDDVIRVHVECPATIVPYVIQARWETDGPNYSTNGGNDYGGIKGTSDFTWGSLIAIEDGAANSSQVAQVSTQGRSLYERYNNINTSSTKSKTMYRETSKGSATNFYIKLVSDITQDLATDVAYLDHPVGVAFCVHATNNTGYVLGMTPSTKTNGARGSGVWKFDGTSTPISVVTEEVLISLNKPQILEVIIQKGLVAYIRNGTFVGSAYDNTYLNGGTLGLWISGRGTNANGGGYVRNYGTRAWMI